MTWIFSKTIDVAVFGGSAALALLLLAFAPASASAPTPTWTWIAGVLLVDVAHVWSTMFVVYVDPVERRRRPLLYTLVPIGCFAAGAILYQLFGIDGFWRAIAYLAVFHFMRQQYGWVRMYGGRSIVDAAAIYMATLYPLIWWHAHPRAFSWMRDGDFVSLPRWTVSVAFALYVIAGIAYIAKAIVKPAPWGKHLVVATTAACWYVGIIATNSDYAFTVTNVFIHGIPYLVLVAIYARRVGKVRILSGARGIAIFLGSLWMIAYAEEFLWDRAIWHDHPTLFGGGWNSGGWVALIAPLLATPQLAHYVLDAFLWRRASNPRLSELRA